LRDIFYAQVIPSVREEVIEFFKVFSKEHVVGMFKIVMENIMSDIGCPYLNRRRLMSKRSYPHATIKGIKKRLHRHIMEEHLGRELLPNEHVYHINGDHLDNTVDNLVVLTKNKRNEK
jgi:HNH endonuclease